MKILVVTQYFWPEFFLVNGLVSDLVKRGHQVQILTGMPNYPSGNYFDHYSLLKGPWNEIFEGAQIVRVPILPRKKGFFNLFCNYVSFVLSASVFGLFRIKEKPDVIFCYAPSPITACLPAIVMKWRFRRKLSFWVQDLWPESLEAVGVTRSRFILNTVGVLVRFIYSQCDQILIQSEAFRAKVRKWNVNDDKIFYVPNWASSSVITEATPQWITDLPKGFRIIFAGNVGKAQDMPTMIEAATWIKKNAPEITDLHWVIVGDGSHREFVEQELNVRSLKSTVHVCGQHPNSEMPSLFAAADALLVTLKDEEIFSLTVPAKVQSYMAAGRPILASINGEGARLVELAGAGLTCPAQNPQRLAETVIKLYRLSADEKQKMGLAGKKFFLENFQQKTVIDSITSLFQRLL